MESLALLNRFYLLSSTAAFADAVLVQKGGPTQSEAVNW
jgi:hypothetical protein